MADKNLLPGWEAFQTDEGEWYYYHEGREETTWDKPEAPKAAPKPAPRAAAPKAAAVRSAAPVAAARPKMPAGGGMGGLLGDIQKGKAPEKSRAASRKRPRGQGRRGWWWARGHPREVAAARAPERDRVVAADFRDGLLAGPS